MLGTFQLGYLRCDLPKLASSVVSDAAVFSRVERPTCSGLEPRQRAVLELVDRVLVGQD